MKISGPKVDLYHVQSVTERNVHQGEIGAAKMIEFLSDSRQKARCEKKECRACFYLNSSRWGGAAMTEGSCGICAEVKLFGSTVIDALCEKCATKHRLCIHCGGDVNMKMRRSLDI